MRNWLKSSIFLSILISFLSGKVANGQLVAPVIVSQALGSNPLLVSEDGSVAVLPSHFVYVYLGDPADLSIVVSAGANYTVTGGNTIVPDPDYSGPITAPIVMTDGSLTSASFDLNVSVTAVNDAPTLDAIGDVSYQEDAGAQAVALTGITAGPSESQNLTVTATSDNPGLFSTLGVTYTSPNTNGTLNIQPAANASGTATVTVTVTDNGGSTAPNVNSTSRTFAVTVTPVNDAPSLNVISNVSYQEDAPLQAISLSGISAGASESQALTVTATSDNPGLFSTFTVTYASPGATGTLNVQPAANASGSATVTVTVTDDGGNTAPDVNTTTRTFTITVTPVNDAPTLDAIGNVAYNEDAPQQAIALTGISAGDSEVQSLTVTAVSDNAALFSVFNVTYTSANATGTLNVQPVANASGTANVTVTVTDNGGNTAPDINTVSRTFTITITPVNDVPTLAAISNVSYPEDAGLQAVALSGISAGVSEVQNLAVTAVSDNPALFSTLSVTYTSPSATGTLNIQPAPNAFGTASVTVTVTDDGSNVLPHVNSVSRTFTVTITPTNDAPTLDAIGNVVLQEDAPLQGIPLTGITAGPLETQMISVTASSDNAALFSVLTVTYTSPDAGGTLNVQPAPNASGTATVTVKVTDNGGNASPNVNNITRVFTLTVEAVNDAPTLNTLSNVSVQEDAPQQAIALSGITAGASETQALTVTASTDNPGLFDVFSVTYTSPATTGTLNIRPKANLFGPATVTVTVTDNGSNTSPHVNTFSRTFSFNVNPVNDLPAFNAIGNVAINEDAGVQTVSVTGITPGPEETQTITLTAASSNTSLIPNPSVSYDGTSASGTLSFQPLANQFGSAIITVKATDSELGEFTRTFTVTVAGINDAPTLDAIGSATLEEDVPLQAIPLTGISAGPSETQVLTVTRSTDKPELFDVLEVVYTSPQSTGTLNFRPRANVVGTATITVRVTDDGSNTAPNVNFITRTFTVTFTPVNDPPVITGQSALSVNEDQSITIQLSHVQITDPDNNSGFTLSVLPGVNYSVSGNTVTPDHNYNGPLSVPVTVSDGASTSAPFNLTVQVLPINDAPQIIGQDPINIGESQPVTLTLDHLTVTDPDNDYPADFTLNVLSGSNYSVTGNVVTPVANFSGTLMVRVFVNDGQSNSNTFTMQISVNSVNDPPVIVSQKTTVTVEEDRSVALLVTHLNITDPDNTYPGDFTLTVLPGANYTFSGQTITPALNYNGTLSVPVSVSDGQSSSTPFNMQVQVTPVNDAPVITGQKVLSTNEDQAITLQLTDLLVTDPDNTYPGTFTMAASSGVNYAVSGLTITPAQDFIGTLTVPVRVNDGTVNSNTFDLKIQVNAVNDAPVITGQTPSPVTISEDQPFTIAFANLSVTDPDNTYPTGFSISLQSGTNYTFSGTTVTPAKDFTGTLSVSVRVSDGANNSAPFNFQIVVEGVNDPPVISGQKELNVNEDQSITIGLGDLTVTDPDNTYPGGFTLTVLAGTNYTFSGTTIQPAANFFGTLSVNVQVNDGTSNSAVYSLKIQVVPVNDPPVFDPISDVSLDENADTYTVTITSISAGPLESQPLLLSATSGNTTLIPQPTVSYNGTAPTATISFKPKQNQTGTAVITVKVVDTGPSEFTRTFTVQVVNINDAPTLNALSNLTIPEDAALQNIALSGITAGPNENQALTVTASSTMPDLFETFEVLYQSPQASGTLKIKPKENQFGTVVVTVNVTDDGSNVSPNVNFVNRSFTLTVSPVNDAPVFVSAPVTAAIIGEVYEYTALASDADPSDVVTLSASQKPAWLTLTAQGSGKALLKGTPPANAAGPAAVKLQAKDAANATVLQEFTIEVDTRPLVSDFARTTNEDQPLLLTAANFAGAFTDADGHALQKVRITALPKQGELRVNTQAVTVDTEIDVSLLDNLAYVPNADFFGKDTLAWKASDGMAYSLGQANIFMTINPINDPPVISQLEQTVLEFVVGEGPGIISTLFEATDVDNDSLESAEIGFRRQNFVPEEDILAFVNTAAITGVYNAQSGILTLNGKAPVAEYNAAIRSITYDNISEVFLGEEIGKTIFYTVGDGKVLSVTRDREIKLIDNFQELTIPNGFTPNNDGANDTWSITNIERHPEASVRVFTMMGQEVFTSDGPYVEWDGTYRGNPLPVDTYYYTINLNLPFRKKVYKGAILILR